MPTILRIGPYRFYFYSHEPNEAPHVHVDRDSISAKYWLKPIALAANLGFRPSELNKIQSLIEEHQEKFLENWYGYFSTKVR